MVAGIFYRERRGARAYPRYIEFDVRVVKEMLFDNNGEVDVNGKAENFTKRRVLHSGCDTFKQEIAADDLDWVLVRVASAG